MTFHETQIKIGPKPPDYFLLQDLNRRFSVFRRVFGKIIPNGLFAVDFYRSKLLASAFGLDFLPTFRPKFEQNHGLNCFHQFLSCQLFTFRSVLVIIIIVFTQCIGIVTGRKCSRGNWFRLFYFAVQFFRTNRISIRISIDNFLRERFVVFKFCFFSRIAFSTSLKCERVLSINHLWCWLKFLKNYGVYSSIKAEHLGQPLVSFKMNIF